MGLNIWAWICFWLGNLGSKSCRVLQAGVAGLDFLSFSFCYSVHPTSVREHCELTFHLLATMVRLHILRKKFHNLSTALKEGAVLPRRSPVSKCSQLSGASEKQDVSVALVSKALQTPEWFPQKTILFESCSFECHLLNIKTSWHLQMLAHPDLTVHSSLTTQCWAVTFISYSTQRPHDVRNFVFACLHCSPRFL